MPPEEKIGHAIDCDMWGVMTPTTSCPSKDTKLLQLLQRHQTFSTFAKTPNFCNFCKDTKLLQLLQRNQIFATLSERGGKAHFKDYQMQPSLNSATIAKFELHTIEVLWTQFTLSGILQMLWWSIGLSDQYTLTAGERSIVKHCILGHQS